jgi:hydrogenase large subunit
MAVSHYLQALEMRKLGHEMLALWGGRAPFFQNVVVGGVGIRPTVERIAEFTWRFEQLASWIENVYVKDVVTFGTGPLKPIHDAKVGFGVKNFHSYGAFDEKKSGDMKNRFYTQGVIKDLDLANIGDLDAAKIKEDVKFAYYKSESGLHPSVGKTDPDPKKADAYTFLKSPRYDGNPSEGGPLSRMLIMQDAGFMDLAGKIGVWPSAVARHAARAYECLMLVKQIRVWLDQLAKNIDGEVCDDKAIPDSGEGAGLTDCPRSANGHWVSIEKGKIANYQIVNASTWNFGPRDDKGVRGPVEEALINAPVPDPNNPINVVRVIRSFDPCLACSVHIIEPNTNEILKFKVT